MCSVYKLFLMSSLDVGEGAALREREGREARWAKREVLPCGKIM